MFLAGFRTSSGLSTSDSNLTNNLPVGSYDRLGPVQVTATAFAVPYIKTTGTPVTRTADNTVLEDIDQSDWFSPREGTLVVSWYARGELTRAMFEIDDGTSTNTNRIQVRQSVSTVGVVISTDLDGTVGLGSFPVIEGLNTLAVSIKSGERVAISVNGLSTQSHGNATNLDFINSLFIGKARAARELNGFLRNFRYAPFAVSDEQLQELSQL